MSRILAALCLLSLLFVSSASARADIVDDYIKATIHRQNIPGLSLAVVRAGKVIKANGYGFANLELNVAAKPETVYQLASVTKQFVAAGILLLVQDGKIGLDDTLSKFIENTPDTWKEITVRHLLTQMSGIKDYENELHVYDPQRTTPEKILQSVIGLPLNFAPGTKWSYSNTGYVLLGMIIQQVSGKTYDEFLAERVFKPLGMAATRRKSLDAVIPNRASGYLLDSDGLRNSDYLSPNFGGNGDGGILSSVLDLAKWNIALDGNAILTEASREVMWTPAKLSNGSSASYGFGWGITQVNGHRCISHAGGLPGAAAIIMRYPDDKLSVIVLTNGGGADPERIAQGIARRYLPNLLPRVVAKVDPAVLASCAGHYDARQQVFSVTVEDGRLEVRRGNRFYDEFVPISESAFVSADVDHRLTINRGADGQVNALTLHIGDYEEKFRRIGPLVHTLTAQIDPDPALTRKAETVLKAFGQSEKAIADVANLTPGARTDFAHAPQPVFAGLKSLSFLAAQDVSDLGIERHGGKVSRILTGKFVTDQSTRYVLVYVTADGLITDEDVIDD